MALSILATGFSLGGFVVVPVMGLVIDRYGWAGSFVFSGAATAAVFLPIGGLLVRNSPADVGVGIDGLERTEAGPLPVPADGIPMGRAIRTRLFWLTSLGLCLFFYGMFGWMVHQIPFYESQGISQQSAAYIVSAAAGMGIVARLSFGLISDRIRRFEYAAMALAAFLGAAMMAR